MLPADRLRDKLITREGKGYAPAKALAGAYRFPRFVLYIDHVQPDPFAPPSLLRVQVDVAEAQFPRDLWDTATRRVALEDFIARRFREGGRRQGRRGGGARRCAHGRCRRPGDPPADRLPSARGVRGTATFPWPAGRGAEDPGETGAGDSL